MLSCVRPRQHGTDMGNAAPGGECFLAVALARIMMHVYRVEPEMFMLAFPREAAARIRVHAALSIVAASAPRADHEGAAVARAVDSATTLAAVEEEVDDDANSSPPPFTLGEAIKKAVNGRAEGPFTVACNMSLGPVRGFYVWAWDGELVRSGAKPRFKAGTLRVSGGTYIAVVPSRVKYGAYTDSGRCAGVFTVDEGILRVL